jgi:hypothetical protein
VDDELSEGRVEPVVLEGKLFRRRMLHRDLWVARAGGLDERLRRIDSRDVRGAGSTYELRRESPWSTPTSSTLSPPPIPAKSANIGASGLE